MEAGCLASGSGFFFTFQPCGDCRYLLSMTGPARGTSAVALTHLLVVYVVWGSTYLAIRVAVRDEGGFPPFTLGLTRAAVSGLILLTMAVMMRHRVRLHRRELLVLTASGLLLWIGGNGLVTLAETRIESGLAAVMIAATPIWVAALEALLDRRPPSIRLALMLALGFSGVLVLSYPVLSAGIRADILSVFALIGAATSWGGGSLLQSRHPVSLSPQVSGGIQMLAGAVAFTLLVLVTGEPRPSPTPEAWLAVAYLITAGGVVAFVSYVTVLRLLPLSLVTTYAYVNPVIAVLLGWLILGEDITVWTVVGSTLVLLGVAGIFSTRTAHRPSAATLTATRANGTR